MSGNREIYVCFQDEDEELTNRIKIQLENKGITILDRLPGHSILEEVDEIGRCQFLWVVTDKSVDKNLCSLELVTQLETAFWENKIRAILLRHNVDATKLKSIAPLDIMESVEMILDSEGNWSEDQIEVVLQRLSVENSPNAILPAGNLSHGFAYSHFFGFHNVVLGEYEAKITESHWFKKNPGRMSLKIYELLPRGCKFRPSITDEDSRVQLEGKLSKIEVVRAGNKCRPYELHVYKIEENGQSYFFVAQYPNAISALTKMIDTNMATMKDVDKLVQITRFYYTLETILEHQKNKKCNDKVRLLPYNENEEKPYEILLKAVKKDLHITPSNPRMEGGLETFSDDLARALPFQRLLSQGPTENPLLQETATVPQYDVCIVQNNNNKDREIAISLADSFRNDFGLNVYDVQNIQSILASLEDAVTQSKWILLILSKESLADKKWEEPRFLVSQSLELKRIMMITLLVDVTPEQVPNALRWLTYVEMNSPNYIERLHSYIKGLYVPSTAKFIYRREKLRKKEKQGEKIMMELETLVPAGNVGYGLAWGYVTNYLKVVLTEFHKHIPASFQKHEVVNYICPKKLYIVVPRSCKAIGLLGQGREEYVQHCFKLCTIDDKQAGTSLIKTMDVYSITDSPDPDSEKYYFVGQFPAAVTCLHEMKDIQIAGLKEDTMQKEAQRFCDTVTHVLRRNIPQESERCQFVQFDDSCPEGLSRALIPRIKEDWENRSSEYEETVASRKRARPEYLETLYNRSSQ